MHDATGGLVSYVELGVGAGLVVLFIICCCVCLRCIIRYRHRRKYPPAQRYATQASNASVASEGSVPPPVPSSRAWSAEQGRVTQIEHSTRDEVAPPAPALHGWDRLRAAHDTTSALRAAGTPRAQTAHARPPDSLPQMPLDLSTVRPSAIGRELGDSIRSALDEADDDDWGDVPAMPAAAAGDAGRAAADAAAAGDAAAAARAAGRAVRADDGQSGLGGAGTELLPPGWQTHSSEEGEYYHNEVTGETSWERPTSQRLSGSI